MRWIPLVLSLLAPADLLAAEYYGAIAYSTRAGAHGWAKDFPTRQGAEQAALANCRKHADDCRNVLWFKNACGTLASGPKGSGWAWAVDPAAADQAAVAACARHSKACTVKQRVCTTR